MTMPLLISVPHAGLEVPAEVRSYCRLSVQEIIEDGDEGAADIYAVETSVEAYVTTPVARAILDMNRAEDDRRADGVVKTRTCWNVPVYQEFPPADVIELLLANYYRPFHAELTGLSNSEVELGIDCHTMAQAGPPIGPGPGVERPWICLSNADGTCPANDFETLASCLSKAFDHEVALNDPFKGGYIIRRHANELPWVQLELSRAPFMPNAEKRARLLEALSDWCSSR